MMLLAAGRGERALRVKTKKQRLRQLPYQTAERRLRDKPAFGGQREAAGAGQRHEGAQLPEGDMHKLRA